MATTEGTLDPTTLILYETQIRNLLYAISYAQDRIDHKLFASLWAENCHIDMSRHLPGIPPMDMSNADLTTSTIGLLAGFESTQHLVSNIVVKFDPNAPRREANAIAQVIAYHYLKLEEESDKPAFVTARGSWDIDLVRQDGIAGERTEQRRHMGEMGDWVAKSIKLLRDIPLEGNPELYAKAKERGEKGLGRG